MGSPTGRIRLPSFTSASPCAPNSAVCQLLRVLPSNSGRQSAPTTAARVDGCVAGFIECLVVGPGDGEGLFSSFFSRVQPPRQIAITTSAVRIDMAGSITPRPLHASSPNEYDF